MGTFKVRKIVSATRDYCRSDGYGMQVVLWRDGSFDIAHSENDCIARSINNQWDPPIVRFRTPVTMAYVRQSLDEYQSWYGDLDW